MCTLCDQHVSIVLQWCNLTTHLQHDQKTETCGVHTCTRWTGLHGLNTNTHTKKHKIVHSVHQPLISYATQHQMLIQRLQLYKCLIQARLKPVWLPIRWQQLLQSVPCIALTSLVLSAPNHQPWGCTLKTLKTAVSASLELKWLTGHWAK